MFLFSLYQHDTIKIQILEIVLKLQFISCHILFSFPIVLFIHYMHAFPNSEGIEGLQCLQ